MELVWTLKPKRMAMLFNSITSANTTYTLRAITLALRDIAPYGRNVVYAANVMHKQRFIFIRRFTAHLIAHSQRVAL